MGIKFVLVCATIKVKTPE